MRLDPQNALQVGAAALRERVAPVQVRFRGVQGCNEPDLIGVWHWPGFVRVRLAWNGEFLAQSQPGRPEMLDEQWRATGEYASVFTSAERQAALVAAASLLEGRERLPRERIRLRRGLVECEAVAVWHWPGMVRVTAGGTAELLAQSLPGQPVTLGPSWH